MYNNDPWHTRIPLRYQGIISPIFLRVHKPDFAPYLFYTENIYMHNMHTIIRKVLYDGKPIILKKYP